MYVQYIYIYVCIYIYVYIDIQTIFADSLSNNNDTNCCKIGDCQFEGFCQAHIHRISPNQPSNQYVLAVIYTAERSALLQKWQGICFLSPKPRRIKSLNNLIFILADPGNDIDTLWACLVGLSILQWIQQRIMAVAKAKPSCTSCVWPQAFGVVFREGPFDFGQ